MPIPSRAVLPSTLFVFCCLASPLDAQEWPPGELRSERMVSTVPVIATDEPDRTCQEAIAGGIADPTSTFAYLALIAPAGIESVEIEDIGCEFRETERTGWYHVDRVAWIMVRNAGTVTVDQAQAKLDLADRMVAEIVPGFESLLRELAALETRHGAALLRALAPVGFARTLREAIDRALAAGEAVAAAREDATNQLLSRVDQLMADLETSMEPLGYQSAGSIDDMVARQQRRVRSLGAGAERVVAAREGNTPADDDTEFWAGGADVVAGGTSTAADHEGSGTGESEPNAEPAGLAEGVYETDRKQNPHYPEVSTWRSLRIDGAGRGELVWHQSGTPTGRGCADFRTVFEVRYEPESDGSYLISYLSRREIECGRSRGRGTPTVTHRLEVTPEGLRVDHSMDGIFLYRPR